MSESPKGRVVRFDRAVLILLVVVGLGVSRASVGEQELAGPPADAAPTDVTALMTLFAGSGAVRAEFKEIREIEILARPLESGGMLYFAPPDHLARHTTWPGRSSMVVRGQRVELRDETGFRTLELASSEVARALVDNVMLLMRGDLAALQQRYVVAYRSEGASWVLDLEPRSRATRALLARIRVGGRGAFLESMETHESSGDVSRTLFSNVDIGLSFEAEERERIFFLAPRAGSP